MAVYALTPPTTEVVGFRGCYESPKWFVVTLWKALPLGAYQYSPPTDLFLRRIGRCPAEASLRQKDAEEFLLPHSPFGDNPPNCLAAVVRNSGRLMCDGLPSPPIGFYRGKGSSPEPTNPIVRVHDGERNGGKHVFRTCRKETRRPSDCFTGEFPLSPSPLYGIFSESQGETCTMVERTSLSSHD
jgi:hypothetical protein